MIRIMKNKILLSALAALTMIGGTGCSDFLEEEMMNTDGPDRVYTNTYGFEVAATGLYAWARDEYNTWGGSTGDYAFSHSQACIYEAFQVATDIVFCGAQQDGSLTPFENLSYTPSTTFVTSCWNWGYGLIASCNEMLEYADVNTNWDNEGDRELYQATARFFRAFAYRTLVYLYGDVPWVDKIEKNFRVDFTRTPKAEVLANMEADLEFAAQYLPEDPDKVDVGKLTKWAAKHYLAEVYLMSGKYEEAKTVAQEVIDAPYFELMKTRFGSGKDQEGDVFHDLFLENNQNRTSGNRESIWVMQLEYNTTGGGGANVDWTRRAWNPRYWDGVGMDASEFTPLLLCDSLGGRGLAQIQPLTWWIEDTPEFYDESDIRNSEYNIKRHWYYNDPAYPETYGKPVVITEKMRTLSKVYPVITKFFYGKTDDDPALTGGSKDRMKIRLAETYLFKAEACIRLGQTSEAAKAINEVRRRAGASDIDASQATMDFLLDERIRELVGEEQRRFTLQRTGKHVERVNKYNTKTKGFTEKNLLWPIPQNVIDANTGAEFPQNDWKN